MSFYQVVDVTRDSTGDVQDITFQLMDLTEHHDVEEEEEEEERNEKSSEMRRLVSHLTGQSEERISKNQEIARLAVTKSFLLAASAKSEDNLDTGDYCDDSDGDVDLSPLALPIHQQRDSLIL